jgi:SNF2 family DNA or RNA helicase
MIEKFLNTRMALMCIDESTTIKTPSAKRTKEAIRLGKDARYRRILTGSPVTKSPLDVFTQCEFLNSHLLGFSSYYSFRNKFAVTEDMYLGGRTIKQVVGYKNTADLHEILQEFSYRVTKDECLDLPPKVFMRREFEMTKEQKAAYDQMRSMAIAFIEGSEATTTSVIVQLLRLHQISCGFLPLDDGTLAALPCRRLNELSDILEEVTGKVIIWANYRNDIFLIKEFLEKTYGPDSYVTYFGDTKDDERQQAVAKIQDPDNPARFFLGNTQTGGYGITLTEASTVIYYSNNYDLEKRLQSEDRAHRIGQERSVTYIDLVCKDTVDEKIIKALRDKISLARAVTGDSWREWI